MKIQNWKLNFEIEISSSNCTIKFKILVQNSLLTFGFWFGIMVLEIKNEICKSKLKFEMRCRDLKSYVTEQMLYCVKQNGEFPCDIQHSQNIYIHFGKVGMTLVKWNRNSITEKHLNFWQDMSAKQINEEFATQEWKKAEW